MKAIVTTMNLTLVESVRFALEAEGIDSSVTGGPAPFSSYTVSVDDADFDRAMTVRRTVNVSTLAGFRHGLPRMFLMAVVVAVVVYLVIRLIYSKRGVII